MPTRGALMAVASSGAFAGALASGLPSTLTSKPSTALFHTSGLAAAIAYATPLASGFVTLTLAPPLSNRFITRADRAPLYGNRQAPPVFMAWSGYFGVEVSFRSASELSSGLLANSVFTPNCIPNDHAETSYGASAGAPGDRRTSGYVCFSSKSLA